MAFHVPLPGLVVLCDTAAEVRELLIAMQAPLPALFESPALPERAALPSPPATPPRPASRRSPAPRATTAGESGRAGRRDASPAMVAEVRRAIIDRGLQRSREVALAVGASAFTVRAAIRVLLQAGEIRREGATNSLRDFPAGKTAGRQPAAPAKEAPSRGR